MARPLEIIRRQPAPRELTDEESRIWRSIVASEPANWFTPGNTPLLTQYCRHIIQAKRIAELLEQVINDPDLPLDEYDRLLAMQRRESMAIGSLASRMRLAQQSTLNQNGNEIDAAPARKPWAA